jgi:hypothetical protein
MPIRPASSGRVSSLFIAAMLARAMTTVIAGKVAVSGSYPRAVRAARRKTSPSIKASGMIGETDCSKGAWMKRVAHPLVEARYDPSHSPARRLALQLVGIEQLFRLVVSCQTPLGTHPRGRPTTVSSHLRATEAALAGHRRDGGSRRVGTCGLRQTRMAAMISCLE